MVEGERIQVCGRRTCPGRWRATPPRRRPRRLRLGVRHVL